jgi:hypothetical protein
VVKKNNQDGVPILFLDLISLEPVDQHEFENIELKSIVESASTSTANKSSSTATNSALITSRRVNENGENDNLLDGQTPVKKLRVNRST